MVRDSGKAPGISTFAGRFDLPSTRETRRATWAAAGGNTTYWRHPIVFVAVVWLVDDSLDGLFELGSSQPQPSCPFRCSHLQRRQRHAGALCARACAWTRARGARAWREQRDAVAHSRFRDVLWHSLNTSPSHGMRTCARGLLAAARATRAR